MLILTILLVILLCVCAYAIRNLLNKIEFYEKAIEEFYSMLSIALHNMRALDQKQMFEDDDEVGITFQQIRDIMYQLRPLLYGEDENEKTEGQN